MMAGYVGLLVLLDPVLGALVEVALPFPADLVGLTEDKIMLCQMWFCHIRTSGHRYRVQQLAYTKLNFIFISL
jgi:hypothetical protein